MARKLSRREMREVFYRMIFQIEFHSDEEMDEQISLFMENLKDMSVEDRKELADKIEHISDKDRQELGERFKDISEKIPEIDEIIAVYAKDWAINRIPKADLTVLRLGVYELKFDDNIPEKIAINEAVEIAKMYGEDKTPAFVNGILSSIYKAEE